MWSSCLYVFVSIFLLDGHKCGCVEVCVHTHLGGAVCSNLILKQCQSTSACQTRLASGAVWHAEEYSSGNRFDSPLIWSKDVGFCWVRWECLDLLSQVEFQPLFSTFLCPTFHQLFSATAQVQRPTWALSWKRKKLLRRWEFWMRFCLYRLWRQ